MLSTVLPVSGAQFPPAVLYVCCRQTPLFWGPWEERGPLFVVWGRALSCTKQLPAPRFQSLPLADLLPNRLLPTDQKGPWNSALSSSVDLDLTMGKTLRIMSRAPARVVIGWASSGALKGYCFHPGPGSASVAGATPRRGWAGGSRSMFPSLSLKINKNFFF